MGYGEQVLAWQRINALAERKPMLTPDQIRLRLARARQDYDAGDMSCIAEVLSLLEDVLPGLAEVAQGQSEPFRIGTTPLTEGRVPDGTDPLVSCVPPGRPGWPSMEWDERQQQHADAVTRLLRNPPLEVVEYYDDEDEDEDDDG